MNRILERAWLHLLNVLLSTKKFLKFDPKQNTLVIGALALVYLFLVQLKFFSNRPTQFVSNDKFYVWKFR